MAGHQASTNEWWQERRLKFEIFISQLVWDEASKGDSEAVKRRLKILKPLPWLQIRRDARQLAKALVAEECFPQNAEVDALHVAVATTHGMDFLLTWNFTHIANASTEKQVRDVCEKHGFSIPVICSPEELRHV
jgi:hypothetical protein